MLSFSVCVYVCTHWLFYLTRALFPRLNFRGDSLFGRIKIMKHFAQTCACKEDGKSNQRDHPLLLLPLLYPFFVDNLSPKLRQNSLHIYRVRKSESSGHNNICTYIIECQHTFSPIWIQLRRIRKEKWKTFCCLKWFSLILTMRKMLLIVCHSAVAYNMLLPLLLGNLHCCFIKGKNDI